MGTLIRREEPGVNAKVDFGYLSQSSDVEPYEPFVLLTDFYLKTLANEQVNYRLQSLRQPRT